MGTLPDPARTSIHATTIALNGAGALIVGASGSGKSTLALHMMALGCDLVADDQTLLTVDGARLIASAPPAIRGQIEARRFGILPARPISNAPLACCVLLDASETQRLPELRQADYCGIALRVFHNPGTEVLPYALLQYLKGLTADSP